MISLTGVRSSGNTRELPRFTAALWPVQEDLGARGQELWMQLGTIMEERLSGAEGAPAAGHHVEQMQGSSTPTGWWEEDLQILMSGLGWQLWCTLKETVSVEEL